MREDEQNHSEDEEDRDGLEEHELVAALEGGPSKSVGFKPARPGNFDGARDRKVVNTWLAEMEDYLHAAKDGRHSAVELAQSYLKGYASTWWRTMRQENGGRAETIPRLGF
jgi:hypothetical protein